MFSQHWYTLQSSRYVQSINTITLKMVKVSKLVRRKLLPYISNIRFGAFWKIKHFGRYFKTGILCTGIWLIKSKFLKNIFCCLAYSQYKSHSWKDLYKLIQNDPWIKWIGEILAELWHFEFHKKCKRCWQPAVLAYFPGQISQQRFIQPIWLQGNFGLVLWALSTGYA